MPKNWKERVEKETLWETATFKELEEEEELQTEMKRHGTEAGKEHGRKNTLEARENGLPRRKGSTVWTAVNSSSLLFCSTLTFHKSSIYIVARVGVLNVNIMGSSPSLKPFSSSPLPLDESQTLKWHTRQLTIWPLPSSPSHHGLFYHSFNF